MESFIQFITSPIYLAALGVALLGYIAIVLYFKSGSSSDGDDAEDEVTDIEKVDLGDKAFKEKRRQIKKQGQTVDTKLRRDNVTIGRVVKRRRVQVPLSSMDYEGLAGGSGDNDDDVKELYQFLVIEDGLLNKWLYKAIGHGPVGRKMEDVYLVSKEFLVDPDHSKNYVVKSTAELSKKVGDVYTSSSIEANVDVRNVFAVEREQATIEAAETFVDHVALFGFDAAREAIVERKRLEAKSEAYSDSAEDKV